MAIRHIVFPLVLCAFVGLTGCKHVSLEGEAETVRVIEASEAASCKKLATTHVEVVGSVLGFRRGESKVARDLEMLARNAAAGKGGNAVVAEGDVEDGGRDFSIYRCAGSG